MERPVFWTRNNENEYLFKKQIGHWVEKPENCFTIQLTTIHDKSFCSLPKSKVKKVKHYPSNILVHECILRKCLHISYYDFYSWWTRKEAEDEAEKRMMAGRKTWVRPGNEMIIPQPPSLEWGSRGTYTKSSLYILAVRREPTKDRRVGSDGERMDRFLNTLQETRKMVPVLLKDYQQNWNPVGVPLLDYLQVDSNRIDAWSYPSRDLLHHLQKTRGLHWDLRREVVVKEIIIGKTPSSTVAEIIEWAWECHRSDQEVFPSATMAYDVKEVKMAYSDFLQMGEARETRAQEVVLSPQLSSGV